MKYFFINSLATGGAERVVSTLARNESSFSIITIWNDKDFDVGNCDVNVLVNKKRTLIFDLIMAFFRLILLVKKNKISAINSHLFWANYLNVLTSFFSGQFTVCTHCVSLSGKFSDSIFKYKLHKAFTSLVLKYGNVNTFKSSALKNEYENEFGDFNSKVIYNPIDTKYIDSLSRAYQVNVPKSSCLVVGRFHKTKGQEKIIRYIHENGLNIKIVFLGDGPELDRCKELVTHLGMSDRFTFLGNVKNPYPYFLHCNYYLSNSEAEGFPNALIEAIYLGCYPIHSDCLTGPREIITNFESSWPIDSYSEGGYEIHKAGILFPLNSSSSMTNALKYTLDNKLEIDEIVKRKIISKVDLRKITKDYLSIDISLIK